MTADDLVGTWTLVTFETRDEDGQATHPFGRDAVGFLTYTAEGRMAVQFGRAERARVTGGDWVNGGDAEIAAAGRDYFAYCGAYELRDGAVIHRVESSLMPNWIGKEQVRLATLEGDKLTLATPPLPIGGDQRVAHLVWRRV
jgi:hypothetical protein